MSRDAGSLNLVKPDVLHPFDEYLSVDEQLSEVDENVRAIMFQQPSFAFLRQKYHLAGGHVERKHN